MSVSPDREYYQVPRTPENLGKADQFLFALLLDIPVRIINLEKHSLSELSE